jgi:hypothetical protein
LRDLPAAANWVPVNWTNSIGRERWTRRSRNEELAFHTGRRIPFPAFVLPANKFLFGFIAVFFATPA